MGYLTKGEFLDTMKSFLRKLKGEMDKTNTTIGNIEDYLTNSIPESFKSVSDDIRSINTELNKKGTYSKPSGGIPKTDLADGVIPTSLPANGGTATNVSGTVAIANGGTGATTAAAARTNLGLGTAATTNSTAYATASQGTKAENAIPNTADGLNAAINKLSTGTDAPSDEDYYVSQFAGGGTTYTSYHRRPMSSLWSYIKGKIDAAGYKTTDTNTWRPLGTTADTACAGNDSRLSNARAASDVYSWAKASSKPSYTKSEVGLGNVDNKSEATIQSDILGALYPVGSVYMSFNNALPDVLKNIGTWTAVSAGYCLRTVTSGTGGATSNAGATGGGSGNTGSTKLTAAQSGLPAHSHTAVSNGEHTHSYYSATYTSNGINYSWGGGFSLGVGSTTGKSGAHTHTINSNTASDASEGHTHTIGSHTHTTGVPANVAIYMWKRTK